LSISSPAATTTIAGLVVVAATIAEGRAATIRRRRAVVGSGPARTWSAAVGPSLRTRSPGALGVRIIVGVEFGDNVFIPIVEVVAVEVVAVEIVILAGIVVAIGIVGAIGIVVVIGIVTVISIVVREAIDPRKGGDVDSIVIIGRRPSTGRSAFSRARAGRRGFGRGRRGATSVGLVIRVGLMGGAGRRGGGHPGELQHEVDQFPFSCAGSGLAAHRYGDGEQLITIFAFER